MKKTSYGRAFALTLLCPFPVAAQMTMGTGGTIATTLSLPPFPIPVNSSSVGLPIPFPSTHLGTGNTGPSQVSSSSNTPHLQIVLSSKSTPNVDPSTTSSFLQPPPDITVPPTPLASLFATGSELNSTASDLSVAFVSVFPMIEQWINHPDAPAITAVTNEVDNILLKAINFLGKLPKPTDGVKPCKSGKSRQRDLGSSLHQGSNKRDLFSGLFKTAFSLVTYVIDTTNKVKDGVNVVVDEMNLSSTIMLLCIKVNGNCPDQMASIELWFEDNPMYRYRDISAALPNQRTQAAATPTPSNSAQVPASGVAAPQPASQPIRMLRGRKVTAAADEEKWNEIIMLMERDGDRSCPLNSKSLSIPSTSIASTASSVPSTLLTSFTSSSGGRESSKLHHHCHHHCHRHRHRQPQH
ncbi:hypothetical protein EK21DRAFT_83729 [Setomelanomma holmii]|uniref:Uncharacterized protein n=1 Tax=Setomelanomma holmii TaxID=210430 RepID=A0A9P4HPP2_9PLEO|nr:hypothetical protein EK21DRAFT_83729 [Setomelanomma holmii]